MRARVLSAPGGATINHLISSRAAAAAAAAFILILILPDFAKYANIRESPVANYAERGALLAAAAAESSCAN